MEILVPYPQFNIINILDNVDINSPVQSCWGGKSKDSREKLVGGPAEEVNSKGCGFVLLSPSMT